MLKWGIEIILILCYPEGGWDEKVGCICSGDYDDPWLVPVHCPGAQTRIFKVR